MKERMIQNFDVLDFEMSKEDMEKVAGLDQKETLFFNHTDPETVEMFVNYGK